MVDPAQAHRMLREQRELLRTGSEGASFTLARKLQRILADPCGVHDDAELARFRAFCDLVDRAMRI